MELFNLYFDTVYLIIIVLGGKLIADDRLLISKPFWLKAFLMRISGAWRVLIFSAIVGIILHYFDGEVGAKKLISTFLLANSFYALIVKYVFDYIESLLPKKDA